VSPAVPRHRRLSRRQGARSRRLSRLLVSARADRDLLLLKN
jgi:hypothetical protein